MLEFIKRLFVKQPQPNVSVTDRDYALMNAVHFVFPDAKKHLCQRHIEQCVFQRALQQPGFMKQAAEGFKFKWNWAIHAPTIGEWHRRWERVQESYPSWPGLLNYCIHTWISTHSEMILSAYTDYYFHFRSYTTNRFI